MSAQPDESEELVAAKLCVVNKPISLTYSLNIRERFEKTEFYLPHGDKDVLRLQLSEAQVFSKDGGLDYRFWSLFGQLAAFRDDFDALVEFLEAQSE